MLCSCSQKKTSTKLLLDWWPNPNHVPIYVGIEKNIFAKYGIDVEMLSLQEPPNPLAYMLSGNVDLAVYYMPSSMIAYTKTKDFKVIAKLHEHALYAFMCLEEKGISTLDQLQGKTVGLFGDAISEAALTALEKRGVCIGPRKLVQFEAITSLYTGAVDFVSAIYWNIEPFQLASQGVYPKCFTWQECGFPDYPELVVIASSQFVQKNPSFSSRFRKALQESIEESLKDPEQAFAIYLAHNPEKQKNSWEYKAWLATCTTLAVSQKVSVEALTTLSHWLKDCKIVPTMVNVEEMLDEEMVEKRG